RAEAAFEIDPFSSDTWKAKILSHYFYGQHDASLKAIETALNGNFRSVHLEMDIARVYLYLGMYHEVIEHIERFMEAYEKLRESPRPSALRAMAHFHLGNIEETNMILQQMITKGAESSVGSPSFYLAMLHAQMGKINDAFEWLDNAYQDHEVEMYWLKVEPTFEPMRNDPRWEEMLDKVGFPD
ncbi:MAG: hypothetical protein OEQ53_05355, partial [Saprospiraceae bacterium]|nr:hypothetical protein [Saprospiraceae bacterium]